MLPRTHLVTDGHTNATSDVVSVAVRSGFEAVHIRAKHLTDQALLEYTKKLVEQVAPFHVTVIVHGRVDIALAAGADGVHLDRDDLSIRTARQLASVKGFLIGSTCRIAGHALRARDEGADYVVVGPVLPSTTSGLSGPVDWDVLHESAEVLPVIAAGDIDGDRVPQLIAAGAYGVLVSEADAADAGGAGAEIVRAVRACIGTAC